MPKNESTAPAYITRKRMMTARRIALAMGKHLCHCGLIGDFKVGESFYCRNHKGVAEQNHVPLLSNGDGKRLITKDVTDPKAKFYPGSEGHKEWKAQMRKRMIMNPTPSEKAMLALLEGNEATRGKWDFQPSIYGFVPDFANTEAGIILEVDGPVHNTTASRRADGRRDNIFRVKAWAVLRFANWQIEKYPNEVLAKIVAVQYARLDGRGLRG